MIITMAVSPTVCDHDRDTCVDCVTSCRRCVHVAETLDYLREHVTDMHPERVSEHDCRDCGRPYGH